MPVVPSDAATVMLVRPCGEGSEQGIEVLMVCRNRRSHFVPGYYVFPGGVVDSEDYSADIERFVSGVDRAAASNTLADMRHPEKALGAWVAAVRETFEEVGILLAQKRDGTPVSIRTAEDIRRFGGYREALISRKMNFAQVLEAEELVLPLDRLHYFSHWITPELLPLRYDVRFFVTEAPCDQVAAHDDVELTGHVWIRPEEALSRYAQGELDMVLPQIMTLEEMKSFRTIQDVMDAARKRRVEAMLTKIKRIGGREVEVMPDETVIEKRPPVYSWPDRED